MAAATQNQALNALVFFFRFVLEKDIGKLSTVIRASKRRRLPVVLTTKEIKALFEVLYGTNLLISKVIYGAGLRLKECLQLRIKDIDFQRGRVTVRFGKGGKDRETVLDDLHPCSRKKFSRSEKPA